MAGSLKNLERSALRSGLHSLQSGAGAYEAFGNEEIASESLVKLLKSAVANAQHNFNMDASNLFVSECFVCPGPTLKRVQPRAQGRAFQILKRTSHVTLVVKEKEVG